MEGTGQDSPRRVRAVSSQCPAQLFLIHHTSSHRQCALQIEAWFASRPQPRWQGFEEGGSLDWWIWEEPSTAWLNKGAESGPLPASYWLKGVLPKEVTLLACPTQRFDNDCRLVPVPSGAKLHQLITTIYQFYQQPASAARDPRRMFQRLGTTEIFQPPTEGRRRHPLSCSGLVRFEGFIIEGSVAKVVLGS